MPKSGNGSSGPVPHKPHNFLFATGIENSYPVVAAPGGGDLRVDEMAKCRHYELWKEDFRLVKELGLEYLRYGPPYYVSTWSGPLRLGLHGSHVRRTAPS